MRLLFYFVFIVYCTCSFGQPVIHSHNDYTHALPFWDAYNNNAAVIEADVYCINNTLMVAHNKEDIQHYNTLTSMYIEPITSLFDSSKTSTGSTHRFYLMIDIKENVTETLKVLMQILKQHPYAFNRQINPQAVQVFISGERPPDSSFHNYPVYIMFDGLPDKQYAPEDINKIVMISDNFIRYSAWAGVGRLPAKDSIRISNVIKKAHAKGKPVRFWGAPDTELCWATLIQLRADVINTDKVKECRAFLNRVAK
jgi:hypothetical protein